MTTPRKSSPAHAVGIDLGTTYSCISYLTPQGTPVTIENEDGELSTPSVVLFDGEQTVVGTEALRNAIVHPERVIQNSKRFMGDRQKFWIVDGTMHRPPDVASRVLRKLLNAAEARLGRIRHAVITVPAQFSELQRQDTVEAGLRAGLSRVDIINEPVAAALCYVLGEGMWFAELADDQTVMVFDLGGGTFDLSLVQYNRSEVKVVASGGDLQLGGIDWNRRLEQFACDEFIKETPADPRLDKESMQALSLEVEQAKRSLSVRPRAVINVQHAGRRKSIPIEREQFEELTSDLVERCRDITLKLLRDRQLGWAHVNSVLITGGATRMPMIRNMLQRISGTTLNATLSPDQSISHGAAYYAGMLLSGQKFAKTYLQKSATARLARFRQVSVNARALGILVRDPDTGLRKPHFLLPAHSSLPAQVKQRFGTVVPNQKRVHLHIVESGVAPDQEYVKLGACVIEQLPANLPAAAPIEVTLRYDEQARVHIEARDVTSGAVAMAVFVREQNRVFLTPEQHPADEVSLQPDPGAEPASAPPSPVRLAPKPPEQPRAAASAPLRPADRPPRRAATDSSAMLERAEKPVPLCQHCGEPLNPKGLCTHCGRAPKRRAARRTPAVRPPAADDDILPLDESQTLDRDPRAGRSRRPSAGGSRADDNVDEGPAEFWDFNA